MRVTSEQTGANTIKPLIYYLHCLCSCAINLVSDNVIVILPFSVSSFSKEDVKTGMTLEQNVLKLTDKQIATRKRLAKNHASGQSVVNL